jgi:AcrR family transcriptional regulator
MNDRDRDQAPSACCAPKGRNAAATREAILNAARRCFAHDAYEQVGVREIAAIAGIDPALVNRYFGSKEGLFAEAVSAKFDLSDLFAGDRDSLGERLIHFVLKKKPPGDEHDPLVALLRSSSSDVAGVMLREALIEGFVNPLAARLDGEDALERAELIGSILLGILVYRTVVGGAGSQQFEKKLALAAATIQGLIDGDTSAGLTESARGNRTRT